MYILALLRSVGAYLPNTGYETIMFCLWNFICELLSEPNSSKHKKSKQPSELVLTIVFKLKGLKQFLAAWLMGKTLKNGGKMMSGYRKPVF